MAGVKALRALQLGAETAAGSAKAADIVWRGLGVTDDQTEVIFPEEDIGYLSGHDRTYIPKVLGTCSMEDTPASYEHLPHILEAGVIYETPAVDGSGSGYIYEYPFATTAQNGLRTYTIEFGDDQQFEEMAYCFVTDFAISGKAGEAVMMSTNWVGRQLAPTTKSSPSLTTVEEILFQKGKLYWDLASGTIGTNQRTSTFLGFNFQVNTGFTPVFTGDGNLYFTTRKQVAPEITCDLTLEHETQAVALVAYARAETPLLYRLKFDGAACATAGTTHTYKTLWIDFAGKIESFTPLEDQDGNDVITFTIRPKYNSTGSLFSKITVVNELSALP